MRLKIFLFALYLIFLFNISRLLENAQLAVTNVLSWYQNIDTYVALDPVTLNNKVLKQILDGRGVSYSGVLEKKELVQLVRNSGNPTQEELADHVAATQASVYITKFNSQLQFAQIMNDLNSDAWLLEVVLDKNDKILPENVTKAVRTTVSEFGIRIGRVECFHDSQMCQRKGWKTTNLIFALPQIDKAKKGAVFHNFPVPETRKPVTPNYVMDWIHNHMAPHVTQIKTAFKLKYWTKYSESDEETVRLILFSPQSSCPLFISGLAVRFRGRVQIGIADVTKENVRETVGVFGFATYLIVTPENSYAYGYLKGESFNFRSMEIFLNSFVPETNYMFWVSMVIANVLAGFELIFVYRDWEKYFKLYLGTAIMYNVVMFFLWMFIWYAELHEFLIYHFLNNFLLKSLRWISSSYVASVIRSDYKNYSYAFIIVTFIIYASAIDYLFMILKQWQKDRHKSKYDKTSDKNKSSKKQQQ